MTSQAARVLRATPFPERIPEVPAAHPGSEPAARPDLPPLRHLRLRCVLVAQQAASLPEIKGSMVRGAFGQALRRVTCLQPEGTHCTRCALRAGCAYGRLFENVIEGEPPPHLNGSKEAPRPYLVEVDDSRLRYEANDTLVFDLLLLGQAVAWQGHALMSVDVMAQNGLGARRHPFVLHEVRYQDDTDAWRVGFTRTGQRWQPVPARSVSSESFGEGPVTVRFRTPTRLIVGKKPVVQFTFRTLAFKMLRRQLELAHLHEPNVAVEWDVDRYLAGAEDVTITGGTLRWEEWKRWSNRQRRHLTMGGVVGDLRLEGNLVPFGPLLRMAEVTHVGKGVTFGHGRVEVVA